MATCSRNKLFYTLSKKHYPRKVQQWYQRYHNEEPVFIYDTYWRIKDWTEGESHVELELVHNSEIF